jgi:hypothetical protein
LILKWGEGEIGAEFLGKLRGTPHRPFADRPIIDCEITWDDVFGKPNKWPVTLCIDPSTMECEGNDAVADMYSFSRPRRNRA